MALVEAVGSRLPKAPTSRFASFSALDSTFAMACLAAGLKVSMAAALSITLLALGRDVVQDARVVRVVADVGFLDRTHALHLALAGLAGGGQDGGLLLGIVGVDRSLGLDPGVGAAGSGLGVIL